MAAAATWKHNLHYVTKLPGAHPLTPLDYWYIKHCIGPRDKQLFFEDVFTEEEKEIVHRQNEEFEKLNSQKMKEVMARLSAPVRAEMERMSKDPEAQQEERRRIAHAQLLVEILDDIQRMTSYNKQQHQKFNAAI